jgi:hypothetical protein
VVRATVVGRAVGAVGVAVGVSPQAVKAIPRTNKMMAEKFKLNF